MTSLVQWARDATFNTIKLTPDLRALFQSFSFEGFDAEVVLSELDRQMTALGLSPEDRTKDIVNMVAIAVSRGNLRSDTLNKTQEEGKKVIKKLVERYGILMINKGGSRKMTRTTITFIRVMQCFPIFTAKFLANQVVESTRLTHHKWDVEKLPRGMMSTAFSSLLCCFSDKTDQPVYHAIRAAGIAWNICFDHTVNKNKRKERPFDLDEVIKFFDLGLSFRVTTTEAAVLTLSQIGVFDGSAVGQEVLTTAVAVCTEFPKIHDPADFATLAASNKCKVQLEKLNVLAYKLRVPDTQQQTLSGASGSN